MNTVDARKSAPSASGLARLALCPASRTLEMTQPDLRTKDSASGDASHALAAGYFTAVQSSGGDWARFVPEDQPGEIQCALVVEAFIGMAREIYDAWTADMPEGTVISMSVEERLFWLDGKLNPLFSGAPDVLWIAGKRGLILDLKSLYGEHARSATNLQLRGYVVLTNEEFGCEEITVGIAQPRVSRTVQTVCYDAEAIERSRQEILGVLAASEKEDAPLVAGRNQCKHCRAKAVCPAAREFAAIASVAPSRALGHGEAGRIVRLLSPEQRKELWLNEGTIKKILEAVDENLKRLPAEELAAIGLEIVEKKGNRFVVDSKMAHEQFKDILTDEQFKGCTKDDVSISALEDAYRAATKLPVKECAAAVEKILGTNLSRKEEKKQLARMKNPPPTQQLTLEAQ